MVFLVCAVALWFWTCAAAAQPAIEPDGGAPPPAVPSTPQANAPAPEVEERGDKPISAEEIMGDTADAGEAPAPSEHMPEKPVTSERDAAVEAPRAPEPAPGPLVVWATAEWGNALGRARCGTDGLEGTDSALRVASTLERSTAVGGLGIAAGGALSDHPLLAYAAKERPDQLASLLASAGFSALALGSSDLAGPAVS